MNIEQGPRPTPEQKPSQPSRKAEIEAMWKTLPEHIRNFVEKTSKPTFERVLQSEVFIQNPRRAENLRLFRKYWKIDDKPQKNDPNTLNTNQGGAVDSTLDADTTDPDDILGLWDEEEPKEVRPSEVASPEDEEWANPVAYAEKMRLATLTQAIKEKLLENQKPLAEKITSLLMNNGFDFIERQITTTTRGTTTETQRFVIFLDPHKMEKWKTKFPRSGSETFDKAVKNFNLDFKKLLQDNETDGLRIAFNTKVLKESTGAGWSLAHQEDAEAVLTYLRDNDKLNGTEPTSYAMYMDPKKASVGNQNMISIGRESGTFIFRFQDPYTEPKHDAETVFWATPVLTIDMKPKVKINPSSTTEPEKKSNQ